MNKIPIYAAILLSMAMLSGCWEMTFKASKPNEYTEDKDKIASLYGKTQEDITRELGTPEEIEIRGNSTYFIYQWKRSDKGGMFTIFPVPFPVPVPIAGGRLNAKLYCLFLRFDENDQLIGHASSEPVDSNVHLWFEQESELDCIDDYFYPSRLLTPEEIRKQNEVKMLTEPPVGETQSRSGIRFDETEFALNKDIKEYCPKADSGDVYAQAYVGDLHYLGAYRTEKDLIQAYVWYSLAATNGNGYARKQLNQVTGELTSKQLSEAMTRLQRWKPGECENDLRNAILDNDE